MLLARPGQGRRAVLARSGSRPCPRPARNVPHVPLQHPRLSPRHFAQDLPSMPVPRFSAHERAGSCRRRPHCWQAVSPLASDLGGLFVPPMGTRLAAWSAGRYGMFSLGPAAREISTSPRRSAGRGWLEITRGWADQGVDHRDRVRHRRECARMAPTSRSPTYRSEQYRAPASRKPGGQLRDGRWRTTCRGANFHRGTRWPARLPGYELVRPPSAALGRPEVAGCCGTGRPSPEALVRRRSAAHPCGRPGSSAQLGLSPEPRS